MPMAHISKTIVLILAVVILAAPAQTAFGKEVATTTAQQERIAYLHKQLEILIKQLEELLKEQKQDKKKTERKSQSKKDKQSVATTTQKGKSSNQEENCGLTISPYGFPPAACS